MAESTSSSSSGGIGFVGLLTIAFIVLKLTGFIDWSWPWVLSPIWIYVALFVTLFITIGGGILVFEVITSTLEHRRQIKANKARIARIQSARAKRVTEFQK